MTSRRRATRGVPPLRVTRLAFAFVLAVAGLAAVPAEAAVARHTIVRARANASVDVTFTRPVKLDSEQAVVTGGRSYAGFYLHPLGASYKSGTGVVYLHGYREPRFGWHALPVGHADFVLAPPRTIPAGRYRLYVLGDAPVEVRLPFVGYAARTLRATRPAEVAFVSKNVTREVLAGGPAGVATPGVVKVDLPIDVVSDTTISFTTSQLITHGTHHTAANSMPSCIGAAEHPACATEEKEGNGGLHSGAEANFESGPLRRGIFLHNYARYYFPGQLKGGPQTAHFVLAAANVIDRATVASMSIGL